MSHLDVRPAISATYLPGIEFALTVHVRAQVMDLNDLECAELRQAMLDHYVPIQGTSFAESVEPLATRHR